MKAVVSGGGSRGIELSKRFEAVQARHFEIENQDARQREVCPSCEHPLAGKIVEDLFSVMNELKS